MPRSIPVKVTCTEMPQYRRLVDLLAEVAEHAEDTGDTDLQAIVAQTLDDLADMRR
jgi:hypothetical protein